jgi:hypothetical protein
LEQHKPKHDRIIFSDPEPSYSTSYVEEVIIHQPAEEQAIRIESKRSFVYSLLLRIAGFCVGSAAAMFFLSHYVAGDLATLGAVSLTSPATWMLAALVLLSANRIYINSLKDQTLALDDLKAQNSKVILKPLFSYLGWTFLFFLFGFLDHTWFRWFAAWVIFQSGANLRLQKGGFMSFSSWQTGGPRFQSFKFRR